MTKLLELQLQHRSFQWIFRVDFLEDWLVRSPCSPGISQESSTTSQFKSINCLALSLLYGPTLTFICDLPWNLIKSKGLQMSEPKSLISTLLSWISSPAKPHFNKVTRNSPRLFLRSGPQFPASLWDYLNQPITSSHSSQRAPPKACSLRLKVQSWWGSVWSAVFSSPGCECDESNYLQFLFSSVKYNLLGCPSLTYRLKRTRLKCSCVLSCLSHVQLFVTLWNVACLAPLSMGFSMQLYWSGLPCPP